MFTSCDLSAFTEDMVEDEKNFEVRMDLHTGLRGAKGQHWVCPILSHILWLQSALYMADLWMDYLRADCSTEICVQTVDSCQCHARNHD